MQNELTLGQIVDGISALLAVMTPDGTVEVVNRQTLDYFGKTLAELKEWSSTDAVHPHDLPGVMAGWKRSIESGQPYDSEHRQRGADRAYRWFHVQGLPVRDAEGRIVRWCVLQTDIDEQRRAQEALRESERALRQITDSVPGMIVVSDSTGQPEYANKRFLDFTGTTVEDLSALGHLTPIHPDEREMVHSEWLRCQALGQPMELDHRLRRFDGVYRWVRVRVDPLMDDRGRIVRWYGLLTDIDDQRNAEEKLRRSERDLRFIFESIPAMVYTMNADGHVELVNERLLAYLGTTSDELSEWISFIHPDDRARVLALWKSTMEAGDSFDVEHRLRRGDGVYRWFNSRGTPVRDAEGRVVRWYSLLTEVDERKRAEEALRESERELRQLIDSVPSMIAVADSQGHSEYLNRRAIDYLDTTAEGFTADPMHTVHPEDQELLMNEWLRCNASGQPIDLVHRVRRFDGVYRWVHVRGEPLRDRGQIVRWYYVFTDVDEQRRAEEALRSTRRKLSTAMQIATVAELSASIAHEINQPLASVVTHAHACQTWLSHDPPNLERALATLERIIRDGHSAAEVVRRIRALFKNAAPVKTLLDLNKIVAEVLQVLSDEIRDNSIAVETDLEADLPMIAADHVQIQQTLINLVHNAIEAMDRVTDRAKLLVLRSRRQGEELLIQVRDDGVGIKDPTLVFDPFFTTKESGMGMGLAISRSIVEAHGGRIWATANEDAGTTFALALPLPSDRSA